MSLRLDRWTDLLVGLAGGVAVAVFLLVALVHLGDNYNIDHVAGAWMGLAWYVNEGTLYPPILEDGFFGGTRYMPLNFLLNAVAGGVSGEYLSSGKAMALLLMSTLLALSYVAARGRGCPRGLAMGVVGAVIATFVALYAGTTIYGDVLPVTLQLGSLVVLDRTTGRRAAAGAGALAALAFCAKLSGIWGLAAGAVYLGLRDRGRLLPFAGMAALTILAVLGFTQIASEGRLVKNVFDLAGGEATLRDFLVKAPDKAFLRLRLRAEATLILAPIALGFVAIHLGRRRLELFDLALIMALVVTLAVMTDVGTGFNHLLDVVVLVPLVVAGSLSDVPEGLPRIAITTLFGLGIAISLLSSRAEIHEAASAAVHREIPEHLRAPPLRGHLRQPVLSEDPSILIERDQRPVALDTFMLLRVLREDPRAERALIRRIRRGEFAQVVLIMDLELADPWWSESHFGLPVARAIKRNYQFVRKVKGPVFAYRLLKPRRGPP